jgi:branched-chain amino acid aminotransferase
MVQSHTGSPSHRAPTDPSAGEASEKQPQARPVVWINGKIHGKDEAKISVYDHGLLYGDGVFEGIRTYRGRAFRLDEHVQRLFESAHAIWLKIPMSEAELSKAVVETVAASGIVDGYLRVVVTRGAGALGLDPQKTRDPQVIIIADTISIYPREYYESGLAIVTASSMRSHPAALSPRIKSLNYLNNIMAKVEASLAGCVEALMLNHKGEVAECTGDNIFVVKNQVVRTPPVEAGILDGVTRRFVMELAGNAGFVVREEPMTRHDVYVADEVFLTGTAAEVIPVVKVDARVIGSGTPGPVFQKIRTLFRDSITSGDW